MLKRRLSFFGFLYCLLFISIGSTYADTALKPASKYTLAHQNKLLENLPFSDKLDFSLAEKGLIKRPEKLLIKDEQGNVVWELGNYQFLLDNNNINTVNPSLLRQAKLNMAYGLYKVTERIYQVRGYDLANITFIKGDSGWIIFDPLLTAATSKAAFKLVTAELGQFPVKAVIYSHAHADHFGGIKGVVSQAQVDSGQVQIIAPRGFMEHAIKENILAGNAMTRRATYQYGNALAKGAKGQVDAAIGKGLSTGYIDLIAPSREILADEETLIIDGIEMVMQNTPGTESPAEMNTYFPQFKTLWLAENVTGTLHNIYTLRGAEVRDSQAWSKFINKVIYRFAYDSEVMFASHSWPRWGKEYIIEVLEKQRDMYGYLHDKTLNLANKGVTINEIHNQLAVPDVLAHQWYNRGYHGSYSHNVRGIINKYLGFYDANPANLNKLSPGESSVKYIELMGGAQPVLSQANKAFNNGEYRWVAELLNHLIFAQPENEQAKHLQADTLEQLGYQAENAGWRNSYLAAAFELRHGIPKTAKATKAGPDMIKSMSSELIFDFLGVRLNTDKALEHHFKINFVFPDRNEKFLVELSNAHLNNIENIQAVQADLTVTINRKDLNLLLLKQQSFGQLVKSGKMQLDGNGKVFGQLLMMMDDFPFWFNIVTP
ncbi:alkyl/aryl-sulfatase [Colwellia hornerae]|uniref:MBL fold metallo-hydrolase n=1 Tax=Colwellia hornerae TaxID=89402 RepID=A0A5C6QUF3_9GAMM|nr:alkyl sulfatase dimerization domain-containing protein [Colwellia hornerae]TWX56848.1 MBL fold metallo-hydrolase [Colwellia hornerae]TWX62427.1 MBL fold metallo-hydrolase [Colwellia hornerae]TWX72241.1 MBL fold metallo-hydrolase [Colwellia hornerae]